MRYSRSHRPALDHFRKHVPAAEEDALEIHVDHAVPVFFALFDERLNDKAPGIVDEDVDSPKALDRLADCRPHIFASGNIGCDTERLYSEIFQLGDYCRDPIVYLLRYDDICSGERQTAGDSATHTLPGTGYDRNTIA